MEEKNHSKEDKKKLEYLEQLVKREKINIHHYHGKWAKFAVVGDTHIGSIFDRRDLLSSFYHLCKEEGYTTVYHVGDVTEGEKMYAGQEYERYEHGADNIVKRVVNEYPKIGGMTTYFITGNHDLSYWKTMGYDIGKSIALQRKDMVYLGRELATVSLSINNRKIYIQLFHPKGGTAYAISYHPQKYIESLSGGQKPDIVLMGHYHKAEILPKHRNVLVIQAGTFCEQTSFMKGKYTPAHVGGWLMDIMPTTYHLSRYKMEFIPYYEKELER